jgi:hypothetical protein
MTTDETSTSAPVAPADSTWAACCGYVQIVDPNENTPASRNPGRFQRGRSGNPLGLSAGTAYKIRRARKLALSYSTRAIETLASLLEDADSRVRESAAEALLDRAGLRPYSLEPERMEVAVATVDVEALRAQLARRLAGLVTPPAVIETSASEVPALPASTSNEAAASGALPEPASALPYGDGQLRANRKDG